MNNPDISQRIASSQSNRNASTSDRCQSFRVGLVSMRGFPYAIEENYRRLESYVREAANLGAELVVAPESVLDGYCCTYPTSRRRMITVAQRIPDGPYLVRAASMCRQLNIHLVFGFLERVDTRGRQPRLRNSCVMLSPLGNVIYRYSKVFPQTEQWIDAGRNMPCKNTPFGRMGMLICADRTIAEHFSPYAAQGAEIVAIPMDGGGGPINTRVMRKHAVEGGFAILIANTWSRVIVLQDGSIALEEYQTEGVSVGKIGVQQQSPPLIHASSLVEHTLTRFSDHWDQKGHPTRKERQSRRIFRRKKSIQQRRIDTLLAQEDFAIGDGMINLSGTRVTDTGIQHLVKFKEHVQCLWLRGCAITDAGAEILSRLHRLRALDIRGTRCTDLCLEYIAKCSLLTFLDLSHTNIKGINFQALCRLNQLTRLRLVGCPLQEEAILVLACIPRLRWLEVSGNMIGSRTFGYLSDKRRDLEIAIANNT